MDAVGRKFKPFCYRALVVILLGVACAGITAQITETINPAQFNQFNITSEMKMTNGKGLLYVHISKNNQAVLTDSILTDTRQCTGFSFPTVQPFKDYFIFSRRQKGNGKIYILTKAGEWAVIPGGMYWAAPKHKCLFILAERDNTNLVIYNLKTMKTVIEKFNCDEFTGWYYQNGTYLGKVVMECGNEPTIEKEISEWMNPVEVEKFNLKTQTLSESHTTEQDLKKAKPLMQYAKCK